MNTMVGLQASLHTSVGEEISDLMKSDSKLPSGDGNNNNNNTDNTATNYNNNNNVGDDMCNDNNSYDSFGEVGFDDDFDPDALLNSPLFNNLSNGKLHASGSSEDSFGAFNEVTITAVGNESGDTKGTASSSDRTGSPNMTTGGMVTETINPNLTFNNSNSLKQMQLTSSPPSQPMNSFLPRNYEVVKNQTVPLQAPPPLVTMPIVNGNAGPAGVGPYRNAPSRTSSTASTATFASDAGGNYAINHMNNNNNMTSSAASLTDDDDGDSFGGDLGPGNSPSYGSQAIPAAIPTRVQVPVDLQVQMQQQMNISSSSNHCIPIMQQQQQPQQQQSMSPSPTMMQQQNGMTGMINNNGPPQPGRRQPSPPNGPMLTSFREQSSTSAQAQQQAQQYLQLQEQLQQQRMLQQQQEMLEQQAQQQQQQNQIQQQQQLLQMQMSQQQQQQMQMSQQQQQQQMQMSPQQMYQQQQDLLFQQQQAMQQGMQQQQQDGGMDSSFVGGGAMPQPRLLQNNARSSVSYCARPAPRAAASMGQLQQMQQVVLGVGGGIGGSGRGDLSLSQSMHGGEPAALYGHRRIPHNNAANPNLLGGLSQSSHESRSYSMGYAPAGVEPPASLNEAMEKLCETMKRSAMSRSLVKQFSGRSLVKTNSARSLLGRQNSGLLMKQRSNRNIMDDGSGRESAGVTASVPIRRPSSTKHHIHHVPPGRGVYRHDSQRSLSHSNHSVGGGNVSLQIDGRTLGSLL